MRMVADAVGFEPVSTANSLLTGKKTGNFVNPPALAILKADTRAKSKAYSQIPYETEQGNFLKEQGICTREQRI